MTPKLTLYSRQDCCLCDEMKTVISQVAATIPFEMEEIDIDRSAELLQQFCDQVPVLFINGHKAFKYRLTAAELTRKLHHQTRPFLSRLSRIIGKESS